MKKEEVFIRSIQSLYNYTCIVRIIGGGSSDVYINKCIEWCVLTGKGVNFPNYALAIHISKFAAPSSPFKDG